MENVEEKGYFVDMVLCAKRISINETDVMASKNIIQLLNWQIEISKDIANITGQMELANARYHADAEVGDPKKYAKQRQAKRLLELLNQRINVRVQELKFDSKETKSRFSETFVEVARQYLGSDTMQDLIDETQKIMGNR